MPVYINTIIILRVFTVQDLSTVSARLTMCIV